MGIIKDAKKDRIHTDLLKQNGITIAVLPSPISRLLLTWKGGVPATEPLKPLL